MKTIEELKKETEELLKAEHESRLNREARDQRDGAILDAFDRLGDGRPLPSDEQPPKRHRPNLKALP